MKVTFFDKNTGAYMWQGGGNSPKAQDLQAQGHIRVDQGYPHQYRGGSWVKYDFPTTSVVADVARIQADTDAAAADQQKEEDMAQGKIDAIAHLDAIEPDIGDAAADTANITGLYEAMRDIIRTIR